MSDVTAADVKKLRDITGSGMMDCKKALTESNGDFEKARSLLREKGLADAQKRKGRLASEGVVEAYLHAPVPGVPAKIGVLVELLCETDFVAKTDDFKALARDLAMHICAEKPLYLSADDVPQSELDVEAELSAKKVEGKPEEIVEKARAGAQRKYTATVALLEQTWFTDGKKTVQNVIDTFAGKIGENVSVRRFDRFDISESLTQ